MKDAKVITSDIGMPTLTEEQCFMALSFSYMMATSRATLKHYGEDKSEQGERMRKAAHIVIDQLEKIEKEFNETMAKLTDSEKFVHGVEDDDLDFAAQKRLGFITKESTAKKRKLTESGLKRAYIFYYSNPENRQELARTIANQTNKKNQKEKERANKIAKRRAKKKAAKKYKK